MAKDDKEELDTLPPEERVKKLRELAKKKKKEIAEAQKLIRKGEEEITDRRKFKDKVPISEFAQGDLKGLSEEAKEILKAEKGLKEDKDKDKEEKEEKSIEETLHRDEINLEALAAENVELPPEVVNSEYAMQLSQKPMQNLYEEMKNIDKAVEEKGYVSIEEERRVEYLASAVEKKIEAEGTGNYSFTEDVAMAANITQQLGAKLMNVYKGAGSLYKS